MYVDVLLPGVSAEMDIIYSGLSAEMEWYIEITKICVSIDKVIVPKDYIIYV
jgi:hypothetical protein